ncbi:uncharacterized protein LOC133139596 [Conger conger]|uniref:uncharacterized protein LOC133139596 n=1 Tax=Conger conger TaxID=82655 RepID=UPI002A5A6A13|nr:uncharacterized protein LOC133139596 [Conger conger]
MRRAQTFRFQYGSVWNCQVGGLWVRGQEDEEEEEGQRESGQEDSQSEFEPPDPRVTVTTGPSGGRDPQQPGLRSNGCSSTPPHARFSGTFRETPPPHPELVCGERSGAEKLPCLTQVGAAHWWWLRPLRTTPGRFHRAPGHAHLPHAHRAARNWPYFRATSSDTACCGKSLLFGSFNVFRSQRRTLHCSEKQTTRPPSHPAVPPDGRPHLSAVRLGGAEEASFSRPTARLPNGCMFATAFKITEHLVI